MSRKSSRLGGKGMGRGYSSRSQLEPWGDRYPWEGVNPAIPYAFSSLVRKHSFCLKKLPRFHNRKTASLLLLLEMGLCGEEKHDFLIFFSKLQVGKTTGVNDIVLQTARGEGTKVVMSERVFWFYAQLG